MRILAGIAIAAAGALVSIYNIKLVRTFGRINWAEKYLGMEGGTELFYVLLGILISFIGFANMFGLWEGILYAILKPIFRLQ